MKHRLARVFRVPSQQLDLSWVSRGRVVFILLSMCLDRALKSILP